MKINQQQILIIFFIDSVGVEKKVKDHDDELIKVLKEYRDEGFPIGGWLIKKEGKLIGDNQGRFKLQCSNMWLRKFCLRNNLKFGNLSGESNDVDTNTVDQYRVNIQPLMRLYCDDQIFNVDETSLFYKLLPSKSYFFSKTEHFGGKLCKERVTLMLCCSRSGNKELPVIVGNSKNSRWLRDNDLNNYEFDYDSSSSAWVTSQLFQRWLNKLHENLEEKIQIFY